MAEPGTQTVLTGKLDSLRIIKPDSGWGFARFYGDDDRPKLRPVNVVGVFIGLEPGDHVKVTGAHVSHPKYGDQFKASSVDRVIPSSANGVISWLDARCPGIGEARARLMVQRWPDGELWGIIENEPHRLAEIKGITAERSVYIHAAYMEFVGERDQMISLKQWGLTDNQISQCMRALDTDDLDVVVEKIGADPYWLCRRVHGFGFIKADAVALKRGVEPDNTLRLQAALIHKLSEGRQGGHVFLYVGALRSMTSKLVHNNITSRISNEAINGALRALERAGRVYVDESGRAYLPELYSAERGVAKAVRRLCRFV